MTKQILVAFIALSTSWSGGAQAADPLALGDVVIKGSSYPGQPDGPCTTHLCRVDMSTGAPTPIGPPIALGSDVAIESATRVLVGGHDGGTHYDIVRVDLPSETASLLASVEVGPLSAFTERTRELTVGHDGRAYFVDVSAILAVDLASGVASTLAAGEWHGLDVEPDGMLRTSEFSGVYDEFLGFPIYRFVRIDPDSGVATQLPETITGGEMLGSSTPARFIEVAASGVWFTFVPNGYVTGKIWTSTNGGAENLVWRSTMSGMGADPDGNLLVAHWNHPENDDADYGELQRFGPSGGPPLIYDYDFGISGVDAMRNPFCSDGADNDGDGDADYPNDVGCRSAIGDNEKPRCDDGIDNDGDGGIDWDGAGVGAPDSACDHPWRNRETSGGCGLGVELVALLAVARWSRRRVSRGS